MGKERNEKLSALAKGFKATKKEREKKKAERSAAMGKKQDAQVPADSDAEDVGSSKRQRVASREADDDAEESAAAGKKKKFHPFGWGAKKTRQANAGGAKTVDIDTSKRARQGKGKGGGKGGKGGKGKQ